MFSEYCGKITSNFGCLFGILENNHVVALQEANESYDPTHRDG
jgi:hypothetical protein